MSFLATLPSLGNGWSVRVRVFVCVRPCVRACVWLKGLGTEGNKVGGAEGAGDGWGGMGPMP